MPTSGGRSTVSRMILDGKLPEAYFFLESGMISVAKGVFPFCCSPRSPSGPLDSQ